MLFKEDLIQQLKFANILTSKLFLLLVEIMQVNIFTKKELSMERECNAIWELKIMELLCLMLIKKMLSMLLSMLPLELQDKDAWLYQQLFLLDKPKNGFMILLKRLKPLKLELEKRKELT